MNANSLSPSRLYFGSYTDGASIGIYSAEWDADAGVFTAPHLAATASHPSFIVLSADRRFLYAVEESSARVLAYAVEGDELRLLNAVDGGGDAPCHLSLHPNGQFLFSAAYMGGNFAGFRLNADGSIGERVCFVQHEGASAHPERQTSAHAHAVTLSPNGRFLYVPDLGMDQVKVYRVSVGGGFALAACNALIMETGAGPRHLVFSDDGRHAYVANELANTVVAADVDQANGGLRVKQSYSTLPSDVSVTSTLAEIALHPNQRFVYVSNRGHDSIAIFERNVDDGSLSFIACESTLGSNPRHFMITQCGAWMLVGNQSSGDVQVFAIDGEAGMLRATGQSIVSHGVSCIA
jgi:6-phosphogluconolactonase